MSIGGWCWHRWTRWHPFVYRSYGEDRWGEISIWRDIRESMQERTCKKCGKRQEEKV